MSDHWSTSWNTREELDWIAKIGQNSNSAERKALLQSALAGMQRRQNWQGIDRQQVLALAFARLTQATLEAGLGDDPDRHG